MALIAVVLWATPPILRRVAQPLLSAEPVHTPGYQSLDAVAAASVAISLALFAYLRTGKRNPAFVTDLALGYMVLMAFALGVVIHYGPGIAESLQPVPMITWVGPMILMFAAIVPAPPAKMLIAGLLAASMDSIGMVLWSVVGRVHFGPLSNAFVMHYPNFLLLGVAVVVSHVVTRLGYQVTREREMGSYRLAELLGRGGMGEVYRATHRMLARPAAIKLIRPEVLAAGDGRRAELASTRFRREAEAAARLTSPHTVELYDFGVTEDGTVYLVMELLQGTTLEALVRREGPQQAAKVVRILSQVCDSLEEAHAAGLVHRDIKPANIHLGRVGVHDEFVKVLDFGLVKSITAPERDESLGGGLGMTAGTPAYMAPESLRGEPVDGRADLYALGCVAYYLLTARLVFEADTALQMVLKHLQEEPEPPSKRTMNPIPEALERIVLDCLAKNPDDRPPSAMELARRLSEVSDPSPATAAASAAAPRAHTPPGLRA
jgi:eukaryotic-like serine/threonine-protein kinase